MNGVQYVNSIFCDVVGVWKFVGWMVNVFYVQDMILLQFVLFLFVIGLVIGVGVFLFVVWVYWVRVCVQEEMLLVILVGIIDVLCSMDDVVVVVDILGLVLVILQVVICFGIEVGFMMDNFELCQFVCGVWEVGGFVMELMRIICGGFSLDLCLVLVRVSVIGSCFVLLIICDVIEQEWLDQMWWDFVVNMSYELKMLVGVVSLFVEVIEFVVDDLVQVCIFVVCIFVEVGWFGQFIGWIMSFFWFQVEDGLIMVGLVVIDEVIVFLIEVYVVQVDFVGVEFVRGGDCGVWVCGDVQIFIEVVGNLIVNVIVYLFCGLCVGVGVCVEDGVVEIVVLDQGIGIVEVDCECIFECFYCVDEVCFWCIGGMGFGFLIVKYVMQCYGGEVWLWLCLGCGLIFMICFLWIDVLDSCDIGKKSKKKCVCKVEKVVLFVCV